MIMLQDALWFLNTRVEIVVAAAAGQDRMSVLRHRAPRGDSPPLHIHDTEDEVFHVLEGRIRFEVEGQAVEIGPGDTLMAPKGRPHSYLVLSDEAAWLSVTTHGDFEGLVRAVARPAAGQGLPERAGPPSAEQAAALEAICGRNHIRLVGPPLGAH